MDAPDQAELMDLAAALLADFRQAGLMVATAESCTGGLIAATLTDVAGSSAVVDRGFVTYSNSAKADMLGVDPALIVANGAVSEPVARAMVKGALDNSGADAAVAVTGIAGPGGGTAEKPVGLVHLAAMRRGGESIHEACRFGDVGRTAVRLLTVKQALTMLRSLL